MTNKCVHYWRIEMPNGATSKGVCKYCMEHREFNNCYNNDISWQQGHDVTWTILNRNEVKNK